MAKKQGFNLNPGADASLVAVATKAAMANVPKDLSGIYKTMSESYDRAMSKIGASFGKLANTLGNAAGQLAGEAIQNARLTQYGDDINITLLDKEIQQVNNTDDGLLVSAFKTDLGDTTTKEFDTKEEMDSYLAKGGIEAKLPDINITANKNEEKTEVKQTSTMTVGDELREIRSELNSLFLKNDKTSQARKRELRAKRDKRFALIKLMRDDDTFNDKLLTDGNVDEFASGSFNMALKLGQNAYKTKGGKITEGDFKGYEASLIRDENDDFHWILKDPQGQVVTGENADGTLQTGGEKPYTVDVRDMGKMLTPKMDQKVVDDMQKIFDQQITFGSKKNTQYLPNQLINKFRPLLENEQTRQQLASVGLGNDDKSLREHFNSKSEYSAEIFAGLSNATLQDMGVTDVDGDGYIGDNPNTDKVETADFIGDAVAESNYNKVQSAIFDRRNKNYDNGTHLKAALKRHIENVGKLSFDAGKMILTGDPQKNIEIQRRNQQIALQNFQTNFPGGLKEFKEINTGTTVVNTPADKKTKAKTVTNRVLSDMTLALMQRADLPSNNPKGGEYVWNQQDNMYYYERTGQKPQPIKDINTFYTNEFGSDYNAQNLMPFNQYIKDWSGDPSKTGMLNPGGAPAGYAGYTMDNNKNLNDAIQGKYYKVDKFNRHIEAAGDKVKGGGYGQKYDDADVAEALQGEYAYFNFTKAGGALRQQLMVSLRPEYEKYLKESGINISTRDVWNIATDLKGGKITDWMNGIMKKYAEAKVKNEDFKVTENVVGQIYSAKVTQEMADAMPALQQHVGKTINYEYLGKEGMKLISID